MATKALSPALEKFTREYEGRYPGLTAGVVRLLRDLGRDYLWESELITLMGEIRSKQGQ